MIKCNFRKSILGKVINLFLVFTFSCYGVVFATPVAEVKTDAPAVVKTATPADVSVEDIGVAIDCGTVKDRYKGKNDKVIIHIQDAHCNFEAQSNINKMLDQFVRECGVDMISVEGAEGIVDTTWFKAFPDAEIRKEVATYFMKKGEITGAEFFSITSDYAGTIYGAETREYYVKNLKAFTKTYPYKTTMETYLKDVRTVANRVKDTIYPAPLKELDTKIRGFKDKTVQLSEFAAYLNIAMGKNGVALKIYPNFEKLVNTLEYEKKINFDIVDQERSQFIDYLGKKLTKKGMAELVAYSIKFKKGHIEAVDFYSFLREKAKEFNIPMLEKFPNLFYYYLYTKIYSGINNEKLFKELDAIEIALKNILIKDDTQRALDKYSRMLDMYINLINIELTNDDYDIFKNDTKDTKIEDVVNFLGKMCDKYNMNYSIGTVPSVISDNIPNMVEFYEVAMKRDNTIIDNTLNEMEKENKKVSVLITGGFHTRGMKSLLESKGISYVVVMPKITKDVETPYIQVLTNQRTSIEDIITENALPGAAMPGSKKDATNQTAKGEMLAPLCRIAFTVGLFVNNDARLKEWSEAIGQVEATGAETVEEHARALFGQIVERFTREWLGEVSAKMVETYGEKAAEEQWAKFLQDDEYWNILFSIYVSKYAEYKGPILESTVALVTGIAKEKFDEYRKTKSPGEGTMRQAIHKGMLTDEEKTATDKAIAATIKSGQAEDVSAANGVFVVLGDKEYYKNAKAVGAPLDVLCVPGTRGTRQQFAEGKIGYDKVDKRFYILQSQFDKLLDAQKEIVAGHEEMHIKISLGIVVPQYAPGQTEEEWINAYEGGRYDIRPIMAAQGSILHMENMIFTDRRFGQAAKDHIVSMREDVSKTWEVSPDVLNDVAETVFYQEMILGQNASQSRRAVNEVLQSVNAKNVQEGMRKFEELQDFIRETYAMYYATETESDREEPTAKRFMQEMSNAGASWIEPVATGAPLSESFRMPFVTSAEKVELPGGETEYAYRTIGRHEMPSAGGSRMTDIVRIYQSDTSSKDVLPILNVLNSTGGVSTRDHMIFVEKGEFVITDAEGHAISDVVKAGDNIAIIPESITIGTNVYNIPTEGYRIKKVSQEGVEFKVIYEYSPEERLIYNIHRYVADNFDAIIKQTTDFVLPSEMFIKGDGSRVGSAQWHENMINRFVEDLATATGKRDILQATLDRASKDNRTKETKLVKIANYNLTEGLTGAAKFASSIRKGSVAILGATAKSINTADKSDSKLQGFLNAPQVRVLAMANLEEFDDNSDLQGKGWFFTREVLGTGLLQAAITEKDINDGSTLAINMQQVMSQLTQNPVELQDLYLLLSLDEVSKSVSGRIPVDLSTKDPFVWMTNIVKKLLLNMPMKPFDASSQLEQRRKIMWSV